MKTNYENLNSFFMVAQQKGHLVTESFRQSAPTLNKKSKK
jgi:hypothetical protein